MRLSERQKQILLAIVEEYIVTGLPVGSKRLSDTLSIKVSSATIRSDMAQLYDLGFLEQPHTSAGRVPSHLGIREYIDELMHLEPLTSGEKNGISSLFNVRNPEPERLLKDAAEALSSYTGYPSVTSSVMAETVKIKSLEFVAAGQNAIVIVLVATNGDIRSKVVRVDFLVTHELISFFNKFAGDRFENKGINSITAEYIGSVSHVLGEYSQVFITVLISIFELCKEISDGRYYISGTNKVLGYTDDNNPFTRDLMKVLEDEESLHRLFNPGTKDVLIVIGKENALEELSSSTVVVTHYNIGEIPAGTVGLVGPVRLDYAKIIPHLEYFAETLGELMTQTLNPFGFGER